MIGHPFVCPDMVGGGDLAQFADTTSIDQELFVRYAQCAALFPMLQFSLSPWRVLDPEPLHAVREAVALRQRLLPDLLRLVRGAAATGEPVLRPLAYHHPGYADTTDQFLLGEDLPVSPVLEPEARTRTIVLPPGHWAAADGETYRGPATLCLPVGPTSLPWFRRDRAAEGGAPPSA